MKSKKWTGVEPVHFLILAACDLDLVPQLLQNLRHALTVFSLNFDHTVFDRPAGAAFLFEFLGEGFHIIFGEDEVLDNRYDLPSPAARLTVQIRRLLLRRKRFPSP